MTTPRNPHATVTRVAPTPWVQKSALEIAPKVIEWRRHIHRHPELGNFETRAAAYVASHLKSLELEVHMGIAKTGAAGVLKGGLPGPTVGLRADMDALPVKETSGQPFASRATGIYQGAKFDVMHACGHDAHTAMLMGAASMLAANKDKVPGTMVFIFQPAEEGAADVAAGFRVKLTGRQAHGSMPWTGANPIVASAQVFNGLQTQSGRLCLPSRQLGPAMSVHSRQSPWRLTTWVRYIRNANCSRNRAVFMV